MASVVPPRATEANPLLLARSVTHELRQPLTIIIGYAELLAGHNLAEPDRALLLAKLRAAAARLAGSLEKLEQAEDLSMLSFGPFDEYRVLDLRP